MKNISYNLVFVTFVFAATSAFGYWAEPSTSPTVIPDSIRMPLHTGSNPLPSKKGGLIVSNNKQFIVANGNVGIATTTPIARLHVGGGLILLNGASADRVLLSDKNGIGSWAKAPSQMPTPLPNINVPAGAVMAFNVSNNESNLVHGACPSGWSRFATGDGRVILGANSEYSLGETGGQAKVVLLLTQIPAHYHSYEVSTDDGEVNDYEDEDENDGEDEERVTEDLDDGSTKATGGQGHNNMMPYTGMTYCIKN